MAQGGLGGGDSPGRLRTFVKQTGISFPVLLANGFYPSYQRGQSTAPYPIDVIIGKKGKIAYVAGRYDAAAMLEVVKRELAK